MSDCLVSFLMEHVEQVLSRRAKLRSKRRSRPVPDALVVKVCNKLQQALNAEEILENDFERKPWEVTLSDRDRAVHFLRFINVWYDLPHAVFFTATAYVDRFLMRIKVQKKFLPCLTASCFNIAAKVHHFDIDTSHLAKLTQSKFNVTDLERMSSIIQTKLDLKSKTALDITAWDLLGAILELCRLIAIQFNAKALLEMLSNPEPLFIKLQFLMCHSPCSGYRSSLLVLSLLQCEIEQFLTKQPNPSKSLSKEMFYLIVGLVEIKKLCQIDLEHSGDCITAVSETLNDYNKGAKSVYYQKRSWNLSSSTMAKSHYSRNFYSMLTAIIEE